MWPHDRDATQERPGHLIPGFQRGEALDQAEGRCGHDEIPRWKADVVGGYLSESSLECNRLLSEEAARVSGMRCRQACLALASLRQPANHSGDIVLMSPTRSSDPAFEELLLAWAAEGRDH